MDILYLLLITLWETVLGFISEFNNYSLASLQLCWMIFHLSLMPTRGGCMIFHLSLMPTGGGWIIFYFFDCSSPFCFLLIEFNCTFYISYKWIPYYIYYYCVLISWWQAVGTTFSFMPALLLSILIPLFLPFSSVSFSFFILAVPMR